MFYVYSPQGRTFAGTMEKLRRVEASTKISKSGVDTDPFSEDETTPGLLDRYNVSDTAVRQYQDMLKENSVQEAVYHAYQVMTQPVVTIGNKETWEDAYRLFERCKYQVIPILNSKRTVIATLSRKHLYSALLSSGHTQRNSLAIELLAESERKVISADPVTDIRRISKVLVDYRLDAVPIVESSHRLVGIVSRTDILRCVTNNPPLSLWC